MMNTQIAKQIFVATSFNPTLGSMDKLQEIGFEPENWDESNKILKEAKKLYNPLDDAKVGDGATVHFYSDSEACTVISRTKKTITLQVDDAELINGNELVFVKGGFAAHCANQEIQKYKYSENKNGKIYKASRRKNGDYVVQNSALKVTFGRRKFRDYNF